MEPIEPTLVPAPCPPRAELAQFARGSLSARAFEAIELHLASCRACQAEFEKFADVDPGDSFADQLRQAALSPQTPRASPTGASPTGASPTGGSPTGASPTGATAPGTSPLGTREADLTQPKGPEAVVRKESAGRDSLPKALSKYFLLEEVGHGGMGTVFRAVHRRLGKTFAVKVQLPSRTNNPASIARFNREMRAIGRVSHANIVSATDAGESGGHQYLVMEYVEGLDLAKLVEFGGRFNVPDACQAVRQAALGLQHIHENGLVHRDVKPSNLLIARDGQTKILDLGLAMLRGRPSALESGETTHGELHEVTLENDDLSSDAMLIGTLDYMAPEQAWQTSAVDIRADLYSLGCTLFKLLAGKAPFQDVRLDSPCPASMQKIVAHARSPIPSLQAIRADVPAEVDAITSRLLAKNPQDRYSTPRELVVALESFCVGANLPELVAKGMEVQRSARSRDPIPSADDLSSTSLAAAGRAPVRRFLGAGLAVSIVVSVIVVTSLKGANPSSRMGSPGGPGARPPGSSEPAVGSSLISRPGAPSAAGRRTIKIQSTDLEYHELDPSAMVNGRLRVNIDRDDWSHGHAGVYFGSRTERAHGEQFTRMQQVEILYSGQETGKVECRLRRTIVTWVTFPKVRHTSQVIAQQRLSVNPKQVQRLEVIVGLDGLTCVKLNGVDARQLCSTQANDMGRQVGAVGGLGVFSEGAKRVSFTTEVDRKGE